MSGKPDAVKGVETFDMTKLKHTQTSDKSKPVVKAEIEDKK